MKRLKIARITAGPNRAFTARLILLINLVFVIGFSATAQVRAPVLDFSGTDITGKKVSISDFRGKVVYLDVWATWCLPYRMQMPKMKTLKEDYKDKDVVFLYVSVDHEKPKWERFLNKKQPSGVHLLGDDHFNDEFSTHYQIYGIPRFMLIDKRGLLFSSDADRPGWPDIRNQLDSLLAE